MLLTEFLEKASANRFDALLCIYQSLEKCGEESETFLYHYAVFFDRYCESVKEVYYYKLKYNSLFYFIG